MKITPKIFVELIRNGDLKAVKFAIAENRRLIREEYAQFKPAWWAAFSNQSGILALLIEAGADCNAGSGNWTPLMAACDLGLNDIVEILLKAGANINIPTTNERATALMIAAGRGHIMLVSELLRCGAKDWC